MFKKKHSNSFNLLDITDLAATTKVAHADHRSRALQGTTAGARGRFRPVAHAHPLFRPLQGTSPDATLAKSAR